MTPVRTGIWTCGVCNQALEPGMQRCPRCRTPVSPPEEAPDGRDGIRGDPLPGYVAPTAAADGPPRPMPRDRRRLVALGAIGLAIALLVGVVWATSENAPKRRPLASSSTTSPPTTDTTGTTGGSTPPTSSLGPTDPSSTPPPATGPTTVAPPLRELAERWNAQLGPMSRDGAVNGGQVVVATRSGTVVSLDARTGGVRWRRAIGVETPNGVLVDRGVVITRAQSVSSGSGEIVAIDGRSGNILWRQAVQSSTGIFEPPAAVGGGRVFINSRTLVALDIRTGRQLWQSADAAATSHAPVYAAGRVAVSDSDGLVKQYDAATGRIRWTTRAVNGAPVAAGDLILVENVSPRGVLYAIDANTGAVRWRIPTDASPISPPARVLDTVAVPASAGLIGVDQKDGSPRWGSAGILPGSAVSGDRTSFYTTSFKLSIIDGQTGQLRAEGPLSDVSIFPAVPAGDTTVVIMSDSVGGYR